MFFFGFGSTASVLARRLREEGWEMAGTTRTTDKVNAMWEQGVEPHIWDGENPLEAPMRIVGNATHILHSIPPQLEGDRVMLHHRKLLRALAPKLQWLGYISTIAVYGDTKGQWAAEDYAPNPIFPRGKLRYRAESNLRKLSKAVNLPTHIFRAGAIYGPERNVVQRLKSGKANRLVQEGHCVSRIHVEDLAGIIYASMQKPNPISIYNAVDDLPSEMDAPVDYTVAKLGLPMPPTLRVEDAGDRLPQQLLAVFQEDRRIKNDLIKSELGYEFKYPTYKDGYDAILAPYLAKLAQDAS